ncbi:MAG: hypothetical protein R2911_09530 [Caldilineaceae bacterium]
MPHQRLRPIGLALLPDGEEAPPSGSVSTSVYRLHPLPWGGMKEVAQRG